MKNKIKALVFDVGGVLFLTKGKKKRNKKNLLSSFKEFLLLLKNKDLKNLNLEESYKILCEIDFKSKINKISKEETLELFSKELGLPAEEVEKIFEIVYKENIIENIKLYNYILKLKKQGYKIGISSIQSHFSKDILVPEKYYENFDALQISCEDGYRKPDKEAFNLILKKLNVKPEESIFIDDKQINVDAAEELKMKGILFKDNQQFFKELQKLNIR